MLVKKAVCMHEEDAGMAWKHVEYRTGHSEVRRMRRLVVSFVATIANYGAGQPSMPPLHPTLLLLFSALSAQQSAAAVPVICMHLSTQGGSDSDSPESRTSS